MDKTSKEKVSAWRAQGKKIVFTNGVFDILHRGHIVFLEEAKKLGDVLVVGLNSDNSAGKLDKKFKRPILDEQSRKTILESLRMVDLVILFEETTPLVLIRELKPDILVKDSDYQKDGVAGEDDVLLYGGHVEYIARLPEYATTKIIEKIFHEGSSSYT